MLNAARLALIAKPLSMLGKALQDFGAALTGDMAGGLDTFVTKSKKFAQSLYEFSDALGMWSTDRLAQIIEPLTKMGGALAAFKGLDEAVAGIRAFGGVSEEFSTAIRKFTEGLGGTIWDTNIERLVKIGAPMKEFAEGVKTLVTVGDKLKGIEFAGLGTLGTQVGVMLSNISDITGINLARLERVGAPLKDLSAAVAGFSKAGPALKVIEAIKPESFEQLGTARVQSCLERHGRGWSGPVYGAGYKP